MRQFKFAITLPTCNHEKAFDKAEERADELNSEASVAEGEGRIWSHQFRLTCTAVVRKSYGYSDEREVEYVFQFEAEVG